MTKAEIAKHHDFVRSLPCLICGAPAELAHLRMTDARVGKVNPGLGARDHAWVNPLCRKHHDEQHSGREGQFWNRYWIDPSLTSLALWFYSGDAETCDRIVAHHNLIAMGCL